MAYPIKTKILRSNRRTLALQILADKTLVVKAPFLLPQFIINQFISKNEKWIEKKLKTLSQKEIKPKSYFNGDEILFMGRKLKLNIGNYQAISAQTDQLLFPLFLNFRIKKELEGWYINQAKKIILNYLEQFSKEMKTTYKSVVFSDTKSKWGSCTHDNRLQFCWRLIMAPPLIIRYVVVHELAHTLEKNHSARFWSKVRLINPSYKQQIKWLRENGNRLDV